MLGSNLGKKVTAGVVQDQYKEFLKNKPEEKAKILTPEERKEAKRAEMRKRGIFVKADDVDETPTILEKIEGVVQLMSFVLPEKPTVWKKKKTTETRKIKKKKNEKKEKIEKPKPPPASSDPSKKSGLKQKKSSGGVSIRLPPPPDPREEQKKPPVPLKSEKSSKTDVKIVEEKSEKAPKKVKEVVEEIKKTEEKVINDGPVGTVETAKSVENSPEKVEGKEKESEKEKASSQSEEPKKEEIPPPATSPMASSAPPTSSGSLTASASSSTTSEMSMPTTSEMKKVELSVPQAEPQRDAFDKLDDDEFEKMTSDADEKDILKHAPKLLKVAKKHAAIEKCLTPEENEVLAKFFSGKQKLDAHVLAVLDAALDKIIDYLQKNNCAVDEETKAVMKKRDKLKAAMMKEFLVSPQYLPKTWTAKFNEWKSEAEKQKNGVNWFRVLFSYPRHKSFDDGPEDTFGNFRRRHRGFWVGIIFGPGDVKSFEETKREDDCQGMFLDTKTIENATNEKDPISIRNSQTGLSTDKRILDKK